MGGGVGDPIVTDGLLRQKLGEGANPESTLLRPLDSKKVRIGQTLKHTFVCYCLQTHDIRKRALLLLFISLII